MEQGGEGDWVEEDLEKEINNDTGIISKTLAIPK